jgi:hypothetical protein
MIQSEFTSLIMKVGILSRDGNGSGSSRIEQLPVRQQKGYR